MMSRSNNNSAFQLQVKHITCQRGDQILIKGLSFTINPGELWQIVGHNGSGKTTLLRTLTGIFPFEAGEILWEGRPIKSNRLDYHNHIYYLGHTIGIKNTLTVWENINFELRLKHAKHDINKALCGLGLTSLRNTLVRHLSKGQRQRVALAKLLLSDAHLWLLDEPFASLDGVAIKKIQTIISDKIERGGSVIFTSHHSLKLSIKPQKVL